MSIGLLGFWTTLWDFSTYTGVASASRFSGVCGVL